MSLKLSDLLLTCHFVRHADQFFVPGSQWPLPPRSQCWTFWSNAGGKTWRLPIRSLWWPCIHNLKLLPDWNSIGPKAISPENPTYIYRHTHKDNLCQVHLSPAGPGSIFVMWATQLAKVSFQVCSSAWCLCTVVKYNRSLIDPGSTLQGRVLKVMSLLWPMMHSRILFKVPIKYSFWVYSATDLLYLLCKSANTSEHWHLNACCRLGKACWLPTTPPSLAAQWSMDRLPTL